MHSAQIERLKLAFAYDVVRRIVGADGTIDFDEVQFIEQSYPMRLLQLHGFIGPDGVFTDAFEDQVRLARVVLREQLAIQDRLALVSVFMDAAVADDDFHPGEGSVLVEAAQALGISSEKLFDHLGTLRAVGSVALPDPEE